MALNGHELIFAHNSPTGLIRLPDLLDYVKENGGGSGGSGLSDVTFTYTKDSSVANFEIVPQYSPANYTPKLITHLALGSDKVAVTADGFVSFSGAPLENGQSLTFQVLTVVDGFAKLQYFILFKGTDGTFTLYDSDVPFSGA